MTNQMGDVISITDAQGNELVQYEYDEWGAVGSITTTNNTEEENTLANTNPLRYRGYYYDSETGYYYLQSRYYDASICRFINADIPEIAQVSKGIPAGTNLFAYCNNNPINDSDPTGTISISAIVGAIIGFGAGAILLPLFADYKGYKGSKRKWFIGLGTAVTTVIGGVLGHYIGKALIALYSKGKVFADTLNKAIAKSIAKITRVSFSVAKGEGYKLTFGKYVIRIMTSSKRVNNYIRISHITKGAMLLNGTFSNNRSLTHISITISNLVKLVSLIFKLK